MLGTPHILMGAAIGAVAFDNWFVVVFALLSHYILDFIPHLDQKMSDRPGLKELFLAFFEVLLGLFLLYIWLVKWDLAAVGKIWLGVGVCLLPDFFDNFPILAPFLHRFWIFKIFWRWHQIVQRPTAKLIYDWRGYFLGFLTQLIVVAFCLWLIWWAK